MRGVLGAAAAALVLALAACGGGTPAPATSGNALVCQHYLAQRSWLKHVTYPTLADALKFRGYVAADDGQAQPGTQLRRDLDAMSADMAASRPDYAASKRVYYDCAP